jgi:hypothetical protein
MTYSTRISGGGSRFAACYAIVIQGIPTVFVRGHTTVTSAILELTGWGTVPHFELVARQGGVYDFEMGTKSIDLRNRRMVGGSFRFSVIDDEAESVKALFSMRIRRNTFLRVSKGYIDTGSFEVSSSAGLPNTGFVYMGAETIRYTAKAAGPDSINVDVTGRGMFGSLPTAHHGTTAGGTSIFTQPPNWIGRRVKVIAFFVEEDGTMLTSEAQVIDTYRIDSNPQQSSSGVFEFSCSHLSDEVATRQLGVGLDPVPVLYDPFPVTTSTERRFAIQKTRKFDVATGYKTHALFAKTAAGYSVNELNLTTQFAAYTRIDFNFRNEVDATGVDDVAGSESVRHICILKNEPVGKLALMALTSRIGNLANGSYDLLTGYVDEGVDGAGFRFGAGIPSAEVDTAAFLAAGLNAPWFSYVISEQVNAADFLRDFCLAAECFWLVDNNGLLTVKPYAQDANSSDFTLTEIIGDPRVMVEENAIIPRLQLECNFNAVTGKYLQKIVLFDNDVVKKYPSREDTYLVKSKSIHLSPSNGPIEDEISLPTLTLGEIESIFRRFQYEDSRGRLIVQTTTHLDFLASAGLGSIVGIGFSANDFAGGDVSGALARVVSLTPRKDDGVVDIDLHIIERTSTIAPSAIISGVVGDVYTLSSSAFAGDDNTGSPALQFGPVGVAWNCLIFDVSTGASHMTYATTLTATTVQLGEVPVFGIALNADFITVATMGDRDDSLVDNVAGFGVDDFIYQQPDTEILTINTFQTRWR